MISRIIKIRESEGLSQERFAEKLELSRNFINQVENGKKNMSDRTISDICRKFDINEEWLRYGTGEMKIPKEGKLSSYLAQISKGDDEFIKDLIAVYMELDQVSKDALKKIAQKMAEQQKKIREQ